MFKWLKKVMISIINAIKSLFVGNREVISVSVGDHQVYPEASLWPTVDSMHHWVIRSISPRYSSLSSLNAAGTSYVEMVATYDVYLGREGGMLSEEGLTMVCPIDADSLPSWLSLQNNTKIYGENRGTQNPNTSAGQSRTATISCAPIPSGIGIRLGSGVSLNQSVTQSANSIRVVGTEIERVNLYCSSPVISKSFEPDDNDLTLSISDGAISNMSYYIDGYTIKNYASGSFYGNDSNVSWTIDAVTGQYNSPCSWITITPDTSVSSTTMGTLSISSYSGSPGDSRTASLRIYSGSPTGSGSITITIQQTVSAYVFTGPSSVGQQPRYAGTFTITYTASNNGQALTTSELNSINYSFTSNGIGCTYVSRRVSGTSVYFTFQRPINPSESVRTSRITATFAGKSVTTTVTQAAGISISGVKVAAYSLSGSDFVLGTVSRSTGESLGILIASKTAIDSNKTAQFIIDWKYSGSSETYNEGDSGPVVVAIPSGSYVRVGTNTFYGKWIVSEALEGLSIDESYTGVEITDVNMFVVS